MFGAQTDDPADTPLLGAQRIDLDNRFALLISERDLDAARGSDAVDALHHALEIVFSRDGYDRYIE